jgi:hypothetical protein
MKTKKIRWVIYAVWLISVWTLPVSSNVAAQKRINNQRRTEIEPPTNCETALMWLDAAMTEAQKDKEGYIIFVARLGDSEKSPALNQKRLRAAKDYIVERAANKIVTAYGERIKGHGRLEIYVGGKMLYFLTFPRNGQISCRGLG